MHPHAAIIEFAESRIRHLIGELAKSSASSRARLRVGAGFSTRANCACRDHLASAPAVRLQGSRHHSLRVRARRTWRYRPCMSQPAALDDGLLLPPFSPGDTLAALTKRLGGISSSGTVEIAPGWDWAVMISGLEDAISRYNAGLGESTGILARVAVGEALWWISATDEFIRKRISNSMSLRDYNIAIQATSAGRRLAALVYLRNRAGHQLAAAIGQAVASATSDFQVIQADGGMQTNTVTTRIHGPLKAFETSPKEGYFFAPPSGLPIPDPGFAEAYARDVCYDHLVAKKPVADILMEVLLSLKKAICFDVQPDGNVQVTIAGSGTLTT